MPRTITLLLVPVEAGCGGCVFDGCEEVEGLDCAGTERATGVNCDEERIVFQLPAEHREVEAKVPVNVPTTEDDLVKALKGVIALQRDVDDSRYQSDQEVYTEAFNAFLHYLGSDIKI